jgi:hypothetical protein
MYAWRAGATPLFLLGSCPPIDCLKIPAQCSVYEFEPIYRLLRYLFQSRKSNSKEICPKHFQRRRTRTVRCYDDILYRYLSILWHICCFNKLKFFLYNQNRPIGQRH